MINLLIQFIKNKIIRWYIIFMFFHWAIFNVFNESHTIKDIQMLLTLARKEGLIKWVISLPGRMVNNSHTKQLGKNYLFRCIKLIEVSIILAIEKLWWIPLFYGIRIIVGYLIWYYVGQDNIQYYLEMLGVSPIIGKIIRNLNDYLLIPTLGIGISNNVRLSPQGVDFVSGINKMNKELAQAKDLILNYVPEPIHNIVSSNNTGEYWLYEDEPSIWRNPYIIGPILIISGSLFAYLWFKQPQLFESDTYKSWWGNPFSRSYWTGNRPGSDTFISDGNYTFSKDELRIPWEERTKIGKIIRYCDTGKIGIYSNWINEVRSHDFNDIRAYFDLACQYGKITNKTFVEANLHFARNNHVGNLYWMLRCEGGILPFFDTEITTQGRLEYLVNSYSELTSRVPVGMTKTIISNWRLCEALVEAINADKMATGLHITDEISTFWPQFALDIVAECNRVISAAAGGPLDVESAVNIIAENSTK